MTTLDYNAFIVGTLFLVFTFALLLTYDFVFEMVNSISAGRTLRLLPIKVLVLPLRSFLKEISYYSTSGLISLSGYMLLVISMFFCSFYFLVFSNELNVPFYIFPMSVSFMLVFLCRGVYSKEDIIVATAYKSIYVLLVSFVLMALSFIFISTLMPDFSVLSVMSGNIELNSAWMVIPSILLFLLASYFILDEVRLSDGVIWNFSLIGKLFYYLLLLHLSSMFLTMIALPYSQTFSLGLKEVVSSLEGNILVDNLLFYSYSDNFFAYGPLKILILWVLFSVIALFVAWIHRTLPKMNQKTRLKVVLKAGVSLVLINFLMVIFI